MASKVCDASVVPRVGIGCFVQDARGRVLLGKRMGSHGSGTLALPGGHLELHETFHECAAREVLEETGIVLLQSIRDHQISVLGAVNSTQMRDMDQPASMPSRHYVTIFCSGYASPSTQEAQNLEPEKCKGWAWVPWNWLASQAMAQHEADRLKEQMQAQGIPLPVSMDKLLQAQKMAAHTEGEGGPRTAEEAADWREADEFAGKAPLFEPLVNFFLQLGYVVSKGLP